MGAEGVDNCVDGFELNRSGGDLAAKRSSEDAVMIAKSMRRASRGEACVIKIAQL